MSPFNVDTAQPQEYFKDMRALSFTILFCFIILTQTPVIVSAVEIAPRISDREIIESLAGLKAGQVRLDQRMNSMEQRMIERFDAVDKRFETSAKNIDTRFEGIDKRFEDIDKRFEAIDRRFEAIDKRFDSLTNIMLTLFGAMISLIIAIFAYIAWDRRTVMHPIQTRLQALEADIAHDLELSHKQGSRLTRFLEVFRSMAKTDPKIAEALRSLSLL